MPANPEYLELLISTARVYRQASSASEGMGDSGAAGPYTVLVASGVACRVAAQSSRVKWKSKSADADAIIDTLIIFTDYRDDLRSRDRFIVSVPVDGVATDQIYDSKSVSDPGLMHHHLEFSVERVS